MRSLSKNAEVQIAANYIVNYIRNRFTKIQIQQEKELLKLEKEKAILKLQKEDLE